MNEKNRDDLRKVRLSPIDGRMHGAFSDGWPLSDCIGLLVGVATFGKDGRSTRRFGLLTGVADRAVSGKDGKDITEETILYFDSGAPLSIWWEDVDLAIAEASVEDDDTPPANDIDGQGNRNNQRKGGRHG